MSITEKTNHSDEAVSRLLAVFTEKPDLAAWVRSYVDQVQDIETALFQLLTIPSIDVSEGIQLDVIGAIVGEDRNGRNDDTYRLAIKARIQRNNAEGTAEEMITLVRALAGDVRVQVQDTYPAAFTIDIIDPLPPGVDGFQVCNFALKGRPAGVRGICGFSPAFAFTFDVGPGFDEGLFGTAVEE